MGALGYYLVLPFIYGIALLPFPLLYLLSDGVYMLLYHMIGYRKKVVRTNLRNSFPEKSDAERSAIERAFYRWFCDLVLETLKTLTISPAGIMDRVQVEGVGVLKRYFDQRTSVILVMGHWGNWEWGGARFSQLGLHPLSVIYHPLQNKRFDRLVSFMRTRLGNRLIPMSGTMKAMLRDKDRISATAFIADQTPPPAGAFWTRFLNQDTPVFQGTEKIAQKLDRPILYVGMERTARGRYTLRIEELVPHPATTAEGEISTLHTRRLETDIRRSPSFWLWTHRRWKHKRSAD
jgi:Kdo2-lipid IVA lauroyltransferase/acyltransferase